MRRVEAPDMGRTEESLEIIKPAVFTRSGNPREPSSHPSGGGVLAPAAKLWKSLITGRIPSFNYTWISIIEPYFRQVGFVFPSSALSVRTFFWDSLTVVETFHDLLLLELALRGWHLIRLILVLAADSNRRILSASDSGASLLPRLAEHAARCFTKHGPCGATATCVARLPPAARGRRSEAAAAMRRVWDSTGAFSERSALSTGDGKGSSLPKGGPIEQAAEMPHFPVLEIAAQATYKGGAESHTL